MRKRRFAELREEHHLTQAQLAERLGMATQTMSTWEQGLRTPPVEKLEMLADFYGVSTDYLLGRTDIRSYGKEPAPAMREQALRIGEESINESRNVLLNDADMRQAIEDAVRRVLSEQQQVDH